MAKKKSLKGKGTYAVYQKESRRDKNRIARIKRHMKKHPEDAQSARALGVTKPAKVASKTNKIGQPAPVLRVRNEAGGLVAVFGKKTTQ